MTAVAKAPTQTQVAAAVPSVKSIKVHQHSGLFYWWPVWLWGYVCAVLSYIDGIGVPELASSADKVIRFHPSPLLGWSFIGVVLVIVYFSNVRARGIYSFILLAVLMFIGYFIRMAPGYGYLSEVLPLLRIHLNLAFYLTFSTLLLALWLFVFLLIDRLTRWRFSPGQVAEEHLFGQAVAHVYTTRAMVVRRLPDDIFRHKILGLRFLGAGTGDLLITPEHGESIEIHNVWRANAKQAVIEEMVRTQMIAPAA